MHVPFLTDLLAIFALAVTVVLICHRLRVPPILGFLLTGVVAGPHGLGLVTAVHEVEVLAEFGVVLLLFVIGLELSLGELMRLRRSVFLGGGAQVLLTSLAFATLAHWWGLAPGAALLMGFLAALSSTAIVLQEFQARAQMEAPHGRLGLSMLIFQDLAVVPMMLAIPFLSGGGGESPGLGLLLVAGKVVLVVAAVLFGSRQVVPYLLGIVVRTRNRELFVLTTLAICLAVAWLTSLAGLSLALGAFLAGLVISDSEYSSAALEGVLPFRDVLTSIFFVSIGMLLDVQVLLTRPLAVLLLCGEVFVLKTLLAGVAVVLLGYPLRTALQTGLCLAQVGEFSFILAGVGLAAGLLDRDSYQLFLAASILTMAATPFAIGLAPCLARPVARLVVGQRGLPAETPLEHHLIIVGFGLGGRHLARVAKAAGIVYRVVEMNPDTVRQEQAAGQPIVWGDATQATVLEHLGIATAHALVVVISDATAGRRITELARQLNPRVHLVVRTRFLSEMAALLELGADDVVPEEFETSVEIFTRVLASYGTKRWRIEEMTSEIRAEGYGLLRLRSSEERTFCVLAEDLSGHTTRTFRISPVSSLVGLSLEQARLRQRTGLLVVAVERDGRTIGTPDGSFRLRSGDVVHGFGRPRDLDQAATLFEEPEAGAA